MKERWLLVLGAGSDIARAVSRRYASEGFNVYLAGRNLEEMKKESADIEIKFNVRALPLKFDALDYSSHKQFFGSLEPEPGGVIAAFGYQGEQGVAEKSFEESQKIIDTNFSGCVSILNIAAERFELRKSGFIIGISSAAGDRGKASNYIYGSSKAALTAYLSGLRCRLFRSGVRVVTVKPGFVDTKMTEKMDLPERLVASPEEVAEDIFKGVSRGKDIIYTRWFWRFIMHFIIHMPEYVFKRLRL